MKDEEQHIVKEYTSLCKNLLTYKFAIPRDKENKGKSIEEVIRGENRKATEAYISHLDGLGLEFLENNHPNTTKDLCVEAIYKMSCHTYFPRCGGE